MSSSNPNSGLSYGIKLKVPKSVKDNAKSFVKPPVAKIAEASGSSQRYASKIRQQQQQSQRQYQQQQQQQRQRQKLGFRQNVSSANKTAICTTTSQKVGRRTLRQLLHPASNKDSAATPNATPYHEAYIVPIFQRRYCWKKTQWDTLWHDVLKRGSIKHSLGRLTCTNAVFDATNTNPTRSIIIDGQQRFTTVTLLLAAIRDALVSLEDDSEQGQTLLQSIHEMIFLDPQAMEDWIVAGSNHESSTTTSTTISEGTKLEFCRLVPTFCDRSSYLAAILPPSAPQVQKFRTESYNPKWHRPLLAKNHFSSSIQSLLLSSTASKSPLVILETLTKLLLDGIDMLYFPIDVDHGYKDGTEDTRVIYERLAIRDATFCKPSRKSEYHSMDGTDMIRNLCLGSFRTTGQSIQTQNNGSRTNNAAAETATATTFYELYWLPLERMFQTTMDDNDDGNDNHNNGDLEDESLNAFFWAFLNDPTAAATAAQSSSTASTSSSVIGGRIYHDFETWMAMDFERWCKQRTTTTHRKEQESSPRVLSNIISLVEEQHTMDVGRRLLEYATRQNHKSMQ